MKLIKRNLSRNTASTARFLKELGVPFHKGPSFWHLNSEKLEYIYSDFLKAVRQHKRELHPDGHGGKGEREFQEFSALCDRVRERFESRLLMPSELSLKLAEQREIRQVQTRYRCKMYQRRWRKTPRGIQSIQATRARRIAKKALVTAAVLIGCITATAQSPTPANMAVTQTPTTITLSWKPSPSPDVIGQRLYVDQVPQEIGSVTTYVLTNLTRGHHYYIFVSAYNNTGETQSNMVEYEP